MDELKKYLRAHEDAMQVEQPDEKGIWQRIEAAEGGRIRKRNPIVVLIRFAAAACLLLTIGFGVMQLLKNDNKPAALPVAVKQKPPVEIDTLRSVGKPTPATATVTKKTKPAKKRQPIKEAKETGTDYAQLVSYQLNKLRSTPVYAETPEYFTGFKQQLQQMDQDEALLREDIKRYGLNDQLLESLINIYQQKLQLLRNLRGEITKMNSRVKDKQPSGELQPYFLNL